MVRPWTIALGLVAQAVAFAAWWLVLVIAPSTRAAFHVHEPSLLAFWLADAAVIAASLAGALGVVRGRPWTRALVWAAAGGTAYAALTCVALWLATGGAALAAIAMVPAAAFAIVLARSVPR